MGERVNGIHEVRGSIPLASTCIWSVAFGALQLERRQAVEVLAGIH